MPSEASYIGAYWGNQWVSVEWAGERLAGFLAALADIDRLLGTWFEKGHSRASVLMMPIKADPDSLSQLFDRDRHRRDYSESVGFRVGMWNGAQPEVGLSVLVGAHPKTRAFSNCLVLDLPVLDERSASLYSPSEALQIFRAVIEAWEPAWATWTTSRLREAQMPAPKEPVVGWLTYLADVHPDAVQVADCEPADGGAFIRAAQTFGDVDEAAVRTIRQNLQRASLLRPIPSSDGRT